MAAQLTAGIDSLILKIAYPLESNNTVRRDDLSGTKVWYSTTSGFTPPEQGTLAYDGQGLEITITGLQAGTTYYVKYALISEIDSNIYTISQQLSGIPAYQTQTIDTTPPPTPSGITATAAIGVVYIDQTQPNYTQGRGHLRTHVYGKSFLSESSYTLPEFNTSIKIGEFTGNNWSFASDPALTWHLWFKWETNDKILSATPFGGTNGVVVTTGQDVGRLLEALAGEVTSSQLNQSLNTRINLIDAPTTGLVTKVSGLETTYGTTASAAQSATEALASKVAAENAKVAAELAKDNSATSATASETAKVAAQTAKSAAETSATQAATSATNANSSASAASSSATTAANSASAALGSANAAATKATEAATSATNSQTSAQASETAKVAAQTAKSAAETSATQAATSATNANSSASAASSSATTAANSASDALGSANAASTSASNAATSATNSATSASASETAKVAAQTAKSAAETSATQAATSATNANSSASAASSSATTAANSASAALGSANAASTSASNAATSATNSATSATASEASKVAAQTAQSSASVSASQAATSATNASGSATSAASSLQQVQATIRGTSLALPLEQWTLNGQSIVTITDGKVGDKALRLSGISGAYPNQGNYIAINPGKKYRIRFWAKPSSNAAGQLYFSLRQFITSNGSEAGPVNGGRSPYKPSGVSATAHTSIYGATWGEYNYLWTDADWQTGVKYLQPEFLDNYSGQTGYWDIQGFTIYDVTDTEVVSAAVETEATARAATDGSLLAQYTVKVDNNGFVSGFGLASETISGVPTSNFEIRADKFSIVNPGVSLLNITTLTRGGATATAISQSAHGLNVGDTITIRGVTNDTRWNGSYTVASIPNTTTFTFALTIALTTPATGTIRAGKTTVPFTVSDGVVYINSVAIQSATITEAKIGNSAITSTKIATNAITADKISAGSVTADKLSATTALVNQSLQVGDPVVTGTTISSGSGAIITGGSTNANNTVAFGNTTSNIVVKDGVVALNGKIVSSNNANFGVINSISQTKYLSALLGAEGPDDNIDQNPNGELFANGFELLDAANNGTKARPVVTIPANTDATKSYKVNLKFNITFEIEQSLFTGAYGILVYRTNIGDGYTPLDTLRKKHIFGINPPVGTVQVFKKYIYDHTDGQWAKTTKDVSVDILESTSDTANSLYSGYTPIQHGKTYSYHIFVFSIQYGTQRASFVTTGTSYYSGGDTVIPVPSSTMDWNIKYGYVVTGSGLPSTYFTRTPTLISATQYLRFTSSTGLNVGMTVSGQRIPKRSAIYTIPNSTEINLATFDGSGFGKDTSYVPTIPTGNTTYDRVYFGPPLIRSITSNSINIWGNFTVPSGSTISIESQLYGGGIGVVYITAGYIETVVYYL